MRLRIRTALDQVLGKRAALPLEGGCEHPLTLCKSCEEQALQEERTDFGFCYECCGCEPDEDCCDHRPAGNTYTEEHEDGDE